MPKYIVLKDIEIAGKKIFREGDTFDADYPVVINDKEYVLVTKENEKGNKYSFFLSFGNNKEENEVYYEERKQEVGITSSSGNQQSNSNIQKEENYGLLQEIDKNIKRVWELIKNKHNQKYIYLGSFVLAGLLVGIITKKLFKN